MGLTWCPLRELDEPNLHWVRMTCSVHFLCMMQVTAKQHIPEAGPADHDTDGHA